MPAARRCKAGRTHDHGLADIIWFVRRHRAMLVCYALEHRSHWFILAFAVACALGSIYGFLQGAWPFGLVEAVWAVVALRRWGRQAATLGIAPQRRGC